MNITFLIGNGFDLQMGLESQPLTCVKKYLESTTAETNEAVKKFRELIGSEEEDTWGDFELLIGKITEGYDTKEGGTAENQFREGYLHFAHWLVSYLSDQEILLDYGLVNVEEMAKFISRPLHALRDESLTAYKERSPGFPHTRQYTIVNFNYTFVFDKCLEKTKTEVPSLLIRNSSSSDSISDTIHVHGSLKGDMVLGVNDDSQILNKGFIRKESFLGALIKSQCCKTGGLGNRTKTMSAIASSDLIIIFGMSLGDTDKDYWEALGKWLIDPNESHRTLALYKRLGKNKGAIGAEISEIMETAKTRFVIQTGLDDTLAQTAMDRTEVIFADNVISFNLRNKT
jgi:hypothetical protein